MSRLPKNVHAESCDRGAKRAELDALFARSCRVVGCLYTTSYFIDGAFIAWIQLRYWGDLLLLMFSALALVSIALHFWAHLLIVQRCDGVINMVHVRGVAPATDLSPVREFALMTQCWSIARWFVVGVATLAILSLATAIAFLVYASARVDDWRRNIEVPAAFLVWQLLALAMLYRVLSNFYYTAVVRNFCVVFPSASAVRAYTRSLWATKVNGLLECARRGKSARVDNETGEILEDLRHLQSISVDAVGSAASCGARPPPPRVPRAGKKQRTN